MEETNKQQSIPVDCNIFIPADLLNTYECILKKMNMALTELQQVREKIKSTSKQDMNIFRHHTIGILWRNNAVSPVLSNFSY
jgi:hypothetical protein